MQVQLQRMETHINILSFSAEMNESSEMPKNEIIRDVGGTLGYFYFKSVNFTYLMKSVNINRHNINLNDEY